MYDTASVLFIDSSRRDTATFPNPNSFQIILNKGIMGAKRIVLTHFIMGTGNIPGAYIYLIITEFQGGDCYIPNGIRSNVNFIVPGGSPSYVSQGKINDELIFPRDSAPRFGTFTINIIDVTGALVNITDFTLRLSIRSYY